MIELIIKGQTELFGKVNWNVLLLKEENSFLHRQTAKVFFTFNLKQRSIENVSWDFKVVSQDTIELRMAHKNWWSFLSQIKSGSYGFTYCQNFTKVESVETFVKLVSKIEGCDHLLVMIEVLMVFIWLPFNHFLEGVSSDTGPLFF